MRKPGLRRAEGVVVLEGGELLAGALEAGVEVESVYFAPGGRDGGVADRALAAGARVFDLAPGVVERAAGTVHPQPVIAIARFEPRQLDELGPARPDGLVVVCVALRDPGNAGTVLRTADAAGADAVVLTDETVDPTNPKVVRSSAGSLFHLPIVHGGRAPVALGRLREAGYTLVATVARGGTDYAAFEWSVPAAVVLGNEAAGLPPEVLEVADAAVTVPVAGRAESLNVGAAAAVVCFEAARQHRERAAGARPATAATGGGSTMPGMEATAAATAASAARTDG